MVVDLEEDDPPNEDLYQERLRRKAERSKRRSQHTIDRVVRNGRRRPEYVPRQPRLRYIMDQWLYEDLPVRSGIHDGIAGWGHDWWGYMSRADREEPLSHLVLSRVGESWNQIYSDLARASRRYRGLRGRLCDRVLNSLSIAIICDGEIDTDSLWSAARGREQMRGARSFPILYIDADGILRNATKEAGY